MITRAVNRSRLFVAFLIAIVVSGSNLSSSFATLTLPAPVCSGSTCTIALTSTSDYYQWTVPSNVSAITATVIGGSGGKGFYSTQRALGGYGAQLTETITVSSGDQLYFYVGSAGGDGGSNIKGTAGPNAAGSNGGLGGSSTGYGGGGGGAASEIRRNGTAISNRIVVAGGGGGGGAGCGVNEAGDAGGSASGNTGGSGLCTGYSASNAGTGANITADGAGGSFRYGRNSTSWGGGGGGGYFGGAAGPFGGGGAGSSWIDSNYVVGSFASASAFGSGSIVFTFPYIPASVSSLTVNAGNPSSFRLTSNLTATATEDGFVTFQANGKRISGCIKIPTSSQIANCAYKPSTRGSVRLSALLYKQRTDTSPISVLTVNASIGSRTTKR
jgi:hypothetical protein